MAHACAVCIATYVRFEVFTALEDSCYCFAGYSRWLPTFRKIILPPYYAPESGGSMSFWNIVNHLRDYTSHNPEDHNMNSTVAPPCPLCNR
jgi:hypothetical protein